MISWCSVDDLPISIPRPNLRLDFNDIGWVAFQTFGPCVRAKVNANHDALLLGCGLWSVGRPVVGRGMNRTTGLSTSTG